MKLTFILFTLTPATTCFGLNWQPDSKKLTASFGEFIDSRDNQSYKTVKIGEQEWLAENFAYLPYICPADAANCGLWVYNFSGTNTSEAKETPEYKK